MKIFALNSFLVLLILLPWVSTNDHAPTRAGEKMKGISVVAPPTPFKADPMPRLQSIGVDWVAAIPFGFSSKGEASVNYNRSGNSYQWWGERPDGVRKTIQLAKTNALQVLLKPQLYVPGDWPGAIDFSREEDWRHWEKEYEDFILFFAQMASEEEADLFCLGTEFKIALQKRPAYWLALIDKIRAVYCGPLIYAANWDEFEQVPLAFWNKLDYVGIDAYFPLVDSKTPSLRELRKAWIPKRQRIRNFYKKVRLPIIFTEYGYLSVDGCAGKAWLLEKEVRNLPINEQAQANAIDAMFQTFWDEPYWMGSFLWKWFPNKQGESDYPERDYSPQDKAGEKTLAKWFGKSG